MKRLYFLLLLLVSSGLLQSQSGVLDSTFSQDGIAILDRGAGTSDIAHASLLMPDGKIVLAGWTNTAGHVDFLVLRFLPDGTYDSSFGIEGVVSADHHGTDDRGLAIALQPDGKLLIAGSTEVNTQDHFSLLRLLPDGTPDPAFGDQGWVVKDLGTSFEHINTIAIQSDHKIVTAGRVSKNLASDFAMVRFLQDGQVDVDFGDQGVVITDIREEDVPNDIFIDPLGRIVLGGFSSVSAFGDFALARYEPDGTPDIFFGDSGIVLTDVEGLLLSDYINAIALLDDGKILAAGNANNSAFSSDAGIVRYHSNGEVDSTFGTNGALLLDLGIKTDVEDLTLQPDGKILICGRSDVIAGEFRWWLMRLLPQGIRDSTFGVNGLVTTFMGGTNAFSHGIFVQPDTRYVVCGTAINETGYHFAANRYIADYTVSYNVTPISCFGVADGSIEITVSGGNLPYTYSLFDMAQQSSGLFTGLPSGTYYITVRDSGGSGNSSTIGPIVLPDPPPPPVVNVEAPDDGNMILISVEGDGLFMYSIDGGASFTMDSLFEDLADGPYDVVVTDSAGCIIHEEQVLISTLSTGPVDPVHLQVYPNPASGLLQIRCAGCADGLEEIQMVDMSGKVFRPNIPAVTSASILTFDIGDLHPGVYLCRVRTGMKWNLARVVVIP